MQLVTPTEKLLKAVTRETSVTVRDRGLRTLIVTVNPRSDQITMRPKGLRGSFTYSLYTIWNLATHEAAQRIVAERRAARAARKGAR